MKIVVEQTNGMRNEYFVDEDNPIEVEGNVLRVYGVPTVYGKRGELRWSYSLFNIVGWGVTER